MPNKILWINWADFILIVFPITFCSIKWRRLDPLLELRISLLIKIQLIISENPKINNEVVILKEVKPKSKVELEKFKIYIPERSNAIGPNK